MTNIAECHSVMDALGHYDCRYLATPEAVTSYVLTEPPPASVIWDIDSAREAELVGAVQSISKLNPCLPQLFRIDLSVDQVRTLCVVMLACGSNAVLSVRGYDDLTSDIGLLRRLPGAGRADAAIIAGLPSWLRGGTNDFGRNAVIAAIVIGRRPASVGRLAALLGLSEPALRRRLEDSGMMSPYRLLRWTYALHSLRQAEFQNRPLKAIANEGGWKRPEAVTNRLARLGGMRLRRALVTGGFAFLLRGFAEALENGCSTVDMTTGPAR